MQTHSLSIIIPAYNEEEAIAQTLMRCREASQSLRNRFGFKDIEIIVVSDGSTDRTDEIVRYFREATLIKQKRNFGYGAALKRGFRRAKGDFIAFLDADGTYDPMDFILLCDELISHGADIALGSRLGPGSQMPFIRRVGNIAFAQILKFRSDQPVTDAASGMRAFKRGTLSALGPLPDGLNFTPAMSTKALLKGLHVTEVPVQYSRRIGRSKLRLWKDSFQFLRAVLSPQQT